jgi:hypothetical protein
MAQKLTPEQLERALIKASVFAHDGIVKGMKEAALGVEAKARENCTPGRSPYDRAPYSDDRDSRREPPHMRDVMYSKTIDEGNGVIRGVVGNPKHYALPVHEGHAIHYGQATLTAIAKYGGGRVGHVPARPFIVDAVIERRDATAAILAGAVLDGLRKVIK